MVLIEVATADAFATDVLRAEEPTVVLFYASWCAFCRAFRPLFDAATREYDARFALVSLDDYENPLWETYRVGVVPSLAFFRRGDLVAKKEGRLMRGLSNEDLAAFLSQVFPAASA